jgi:hypothetical protein
MIHHSLTDEDLMVIQLYYDAYYDIENEYDFVLIKRFESGKHDAKSIRRFKNLWKLEQF